MYRSLSLSSWRITPRPVRKNVRRITACTVGERTPRRSYIGQTDPLAPLIADLAAYIFDMFVLTVAGFERTVHFSGGKIKSKASSLE